MTSLGVSPYARLWERETKVVLALEKEIDTVPAIPERMETPESEAQLNIDVVFTSVDATLAALRKAAELAGKLPQVVPVALPLESPPVLLDWNERRFQIIASESSVPTTVRIYLCRNRIETLCQVLKPNSLVVLGGRKRWWPTAESRLARELRKTGHEVVLTELE
jgi:hypothetical protein